MDQMSHLVRLLQILSLVVGPAAAQLAAPLQLSASFVLPNELVVLTNTGQSRSFCRLAW